MHLLLHKNKISVQLFCTSLLDLVNKRHKSSTTEREHKLRKSTPAPNPAAAITRYFAKAELPSQQHTLGEIVAEILSDGRSLNRKAICTKLLSRLDKAKNAQEEAHFNQLLGMLFD